MDTISLTFEVSTNELEWLSKLFIIMSNAKKHANFSGSLPEKERLKEIKELINKPIEGKL